MKLLNQRKDEERTTDTTTLSPGSYASCSCGGGERNAALRTWQMSPLLVARFLTSPSHSDGLICSRLSLELERGARMQLQCTSTQELEL